MSEVYSNTTCVSGKRMEMCTFSGYNIEELNSYCQFTCNCDIECKAMLVTLIPNRSAPTTYEIQEVTWQPVADETVAYT